MPTIVRVGERWRAQIRRKGMKSTAKTFDSRREAEQWARMIEGAYDQEGPAAASAAPWSVDRVVEVYRAVRAAAGRPIASTSNTEYMTRHLSEDLGPEKVADLTPQRVLKWAAYRKGQGAGPYTINMELSHLGTMLRMVAAYESVTFPDVCGSARPLLHNMQLIGGGEKRTRRPQGDELDAIVEHFRKCDRPELADAIRISAQLGLRRGEVFKVRWSDLDEKGRIILVRDRKHPRANKRHDDAVPLLGDALPIIKRQPRVEDRIFPLEAGYASKLFKQACNELGIPDLRFHDLRHEASSRLRDMGFEAVERMAILGHRDERMNDRYTHVTPQALLQKFDSLQGTPPHQPQQKTQRRRRGGT